MNREEKTLYALKVHVLIALVWLVPTIIWTLYAGHLFEETFFMILLPTYLFVVLGTWASWVALKDRHKTRRLILTAAPLTLFFFALVFFFFDAIVYNETYSVLYLIYGVLSYPWELIVCYFFKRKGLIPQ